MKSVDLDKVNEEISILFPDNNYTGVIVDVGAAHPEWLSNSCDLEERGWLAICIEANPMYVEMLKEKRKNVLNYAAYSENKMMKFTIHEVDAGEFEMASYSCIQDHYLGKSKNTRIVDVEAKTLDSILEENFPEVKNIDILSVDVEGAEKHVLDGFSIEKFKPKYIILEERTKCPKGCFIDKLEPYGYKLYQPIVAKRINRFYKYEGN